MNDMVDTRSCAATIVLVEKWIPCAGMTSESDGPECRANKEIEVIHFVLHDPRDTVAVVVVEGVVAGMALNGWIMDEDRMVSVAAAQDIPIGHKVALKDMAPGDTVLKYGIDIGKVVANIKAGEHAHVHNIKTKRW